MSDVPPAKFTSRIRRFLVGKPIPTSQAHHEKLSAVTGLAVFASDNLSSVAYATEAILGILVLFSIQAMGLQIWISIAIMALIAIIAASYRQTIRAYPNGGGSYIVASDNLGEWPGVIAASALMIDYTLTVAVSIAAGVAALSSAFPTLHPYVVILAVICIGLVGLANLRGVRESGALFAIPTYGFVVVMFLMIGTGVFRALTHPVVDQQVVSPFLGKEASFPIIYIILRAFAAGCTALTGIEAVADGTQNFQPPQAKNASKTLVRMATMLAMMFIGMGFIAMRLPRIELLSAKSPHFQTVASQVASYSFGAGSPLYYAVQFLTAAILILAANTAFADFPRLASFLARDGYLPRYMARLGDRLVFHNGIVVLAVAASALVVIFRGDLDNLLPLYAVGVFTAFTLSQCGMVKHWRTTKDTGWRRSIVMNMIGAVLCFIVLLIILGTKFMDGAWIIVVILPLICLGLIAVRRRYDAMTQQLEAKLHVQLPPISQHMILLLVPRGHRGIIAALHYAQQLKGNCQALHITLNEKSLPELQRFWEEFGEDVPLVVLPSPYRSLLQPVLDYVDRLRSEDPNVMISVVVPEAVSTKWYHRLLHENVAQQLKQALAKRKNVVVSNVRYFLQ